ncbi:MAG: Bacteriophage head to tail connecting protein [Firmicutes bacterium ADurb.Bin419]|nr:MAG: Bacteriophage head to tail connecting protein [Firmicutes bacterium ADurb.Bin419]
MDNRIFNLYDNLKVKRDEYVPLWESISRTTATKLGLKACLRNSVYSSQSKNKDYLCDDPTAPNAVSATSNFLNGMMWGLGDDFIKVLKPDELKDDNSINDFYDGLYQKVGDIMFHRDSGFNNAKYEYFNDQASYGTSGIGLFANGEYPKKSTCPYIFKEYGVDNLIIDEGNNGRVEYIFLTHQWTSNQVVNNLALDSKSEVRMIDKKKFEKLPEEVKADYERGEFRDKFTVVHGILPSEEFDLSVKLGKKSKRYRGVWFLEDRKEIITEENYSYMPIIVCRAIKERGEVYGRSQGGILQSTIISLNYMTELGIKNAEVRNDPPTMSTGDIKNGILDKSAGANNVVNPKNLASGRPIEPMYEAGDISPMVSFLIPYYREAIMNAYGVDKMLDFNSSGSMTARETIERGIIRGQTLAVPIMQQYREHQEPLVYTLLNMMYDDNALGEIPEQVKVLRESGKDWFKLSPSDRIKRTIGTQKAEALLQFTNYVAMMAQLNPSVLQAIDYYSLIKEFHSEAGLPANLIKDSTEYELAIKKQAEAIQQQMAMQQGMAEVAAGNKIADTQKKQAEAKKYG